MRQHQLDRIAVEDHGHHILRFMGSTDSVDLFDEPFLQLQK